MLAEGGAGYSASAREKLGRGTRRPGRRRSRKLADVLAAVPTGRLVVLGEPGTGKTMLMVGLVLDLLHPAAAAAASQSLCWSRWRPGIRSANTCTAG